MTRARKGGVVGNTPIPARPLTPERWREREVRRLRAHLMGTGFPRVEMAGLVAITGGAGLLTSWASLHALGLVAMGPRYLFAVIVAYLVFLLLLRAWLAMREHTSSDGLDFDIPSDSGGTGGFEGLGGGGEFGGGGASGSFDAPDTDVDVDSSALDAVGSADEGAIVLLPLLLIAGIALSALFVVAGAPMLMAEVLLDVLLAAGLYRRLRRVQGRHWLQTAVRRTVWPFVLTAAVVTGTGFALQAVAPGASTLGEALAQLRD